MKKFIILLIVPLLFFNSCEEEEETSSNLIGTWFHTQSIYDGEPQPRNSCDTSSTLDVVSNTDIHYNEYYSDDLEIEPCGLDGVYECEISESDNLMTIIFGDATILGNYSIDGNTLTYSIFQVDNIDGTSQQFNNDQWIFEKN